MPSLFTFLFFFFSAHRSFKICIIHSISWSQPASLFLVTSMHLYKKHWIENTATSASSLKTSLGYSPISEISVLNNLYFQSLAINCQIVFLFRIPSGKCLFHFVFAETVQLLVSMFFRLMAGPIHVISLTWCTFTWLLGKRNIFKKYVFIAYFISSYYYFSLLFKWLSY